MSFLFSVCIPAYNRARFLPALLESIIAQHVSSLEVVICEDNSPERTAIRSVVDSYRERLSITYVENTANLGYDGNLRACIRHASGLYCLMMGNDDVLCDGAIAELQNVVKRYPSVGIVTRAYRIFSGAVSNVTQTIVHFSGSRFFPRGPQSLVTLFRRVGVISGIVFRRDLANSVSTDRWDGTLFYQMHLCSEIILKADGFYLATPTVACRDGVAPDFGNSEAERQFYTPGKYTNEARLKMFGSLLEIVRSVELRYNLEVFDAIVNDLANYSYLLLQPQRGLGPVEFFRYYRQLGKLGFAKHLPYHCYALALLVLGNSGANRLMRTARGFFASTPRLGSLYTGTPANQS